MPKGNENTVMTNMVQGEALQFKDKNTVLNIVGEDGLALRFAHTKHKGDKEVVLKAVNQNPQALDYASDKLRGDKDVVSAALRHLNLSLNYGDDEDGDDEINTILLSVREYGHQILEVLTVSRNNHCFCKME